MKQSGRWNRHISQDNFQAFEPLKDVHNLVPTHVYTPNVRHKSAISDDGALFVNLNFKKVRKNEQHLSPAKPIFYHRTKDKNLCASELPWFDPYTNTGGGNNVWTVQSRAVNKHTEIYIKSGKIGQYN